MSFRNAFRICYDVSPKRVPRDPPSETFSKNNFFIKLIALLKGVEKYREKQIFSHSKKIVKIDKKIGQNQHIYDNTTVQCGIYTREKYCIFLLLKVHVRQIHIHLSILNGSVNKLNFLHYKIHTSELVFYGFDAVLTLWNECIFKMVYVVGHVSIKSAKQHLYLM